MVVIFAIIALVGGLIGAFILVRIARMPKLTPKKSVLQHSQTMRDQLFNIQQQLMNYKSDVFNFFYIGDEAALATRAQHITDALSEVDKTLRQFNSDHEPYSSRSSEKYFSETAKTYEAAVRQYVTLLKEVLADLLIIEKIAGKLRTIAKQAEPLVQYMDGTNTAKQAQLAEQIQVLIRSCKEIAEQQSTRPKLPQSVQIYDSLVREVQTLIEQYTAASQQLANDPTQYMTAMSNIQPAQLFDSNSYNELFNHILQQPQIEQYQQAIDQLYYQA